MYQCGGPILAVNGISGKAQQSESMENYQTEEEQDGQKMESTFGDLLIRPAFSCYFCPLTKMQSIMELSDSSNNNKGGDKDAKRGFTFCCHKQSRL